MPIMNRDELIRLIAFLRERLEETEAARKKEHEESSERISALTSEVSASNKTKSYLFHVKI